MDWDCQMEMLLEKQGFVIDSSRSIVKPSNKFEVGVNYGIKYKFTRLFQRALWY